MLQKRSVPRRARERLHRSCGDTGLELLFRRVVLAERLPAPRIGVRATGVAAGDVLERAHALVHVDEIEKDLQQVLIVVVAVPAPGLGAGIQMERSVMRYATTRLRARVESARDALFSKQPEESIFVLTGFDAEGLGLRLVQRRGQVSGKRLGRT